MDKEQKINGVEISLGEDGWLYYYGSKFEIIKSGDQPWEYRVYLDGKEIKKVVSAEFKVQIGLAPIIRLEIIDI